MQPLPQLAPLEEIQNNFAQVCPAYCSVLPMKSGYFQIEVGGWARAGSNIHYEFRQMTSSIRAEFHIEYWTGLNDQIQALARRVGVVAGYSIEFSHWMHGCRMGVSFPADVSASQMTDVMVQFIEATHPEIDRSFRNEMARQAGLPGVMSGTKEKEDSMTKPLNQILYGPPGTGKTYETIYAALQILDPAAAEAYKQVDQDDKSTPDERLAARTVLKARFDELSAEQRVRFVTFHQSFSYEDFVEGLRAETDETTGQIRYEVVDGVFKNLCESASVKVTQQAPAPVDLAGRRIWKMSLGYTLGSDAGVFDECLQGGYVLLGYGGVINFEGCKNREDVLQRYTLEGQTIASNTDYNLTSVTTFVTRMKVGDLVVVSDGNRKFRAIGEITGDYAYRRHPDYDDAYAQMRPVKWLRQYSPSLPHSDLLNGHFSQMTLYELRSPTLDQKKLQSLLADLSVTDMAPVTNARVLIIDEINRGNISRIFGELITLIELSKRAGAEEALPVTLPYSKEPFYVPGNVYLIGTMNTADRSLAGLDLALRRRFSFTEMPPRPALLKGINIEGAEDLDLAEMLTKMNQRITVLLDRDHTIGHAYFMPLQKKNSTPAKLAELAGIFRQKILPLLQEYFFEDWERIRWVLNDQNKSQKKDDNEAFIIQDGELNDLSVLFKGVADKLRQSPQWVLNDKAFDKAGAYLGIAANLGQPAQDEADA